LRGTASLIWSKTSSSRTMPAFSVRVLLNPRK
jgi:hypothetical protein